MIVTAPNHSRLSYPKALSLILIALVALCITSTYNNAHANSAEFIVSSATIFGHPHDLVVGPQNKFLYVADVNNHEIKVLDPYSLKLINAYGRGYLNSPHDVCFDNQGRLLVADSGNGRIVRYDVSNGKLSNPHTLISGLSSPEGVTVSSSGLVYATNTGKHTLIMFDPQRKNSVKEIDSLGFIRPHDIEITAKDIIYAADPGHNGIKLLNSTLQVSSVLKEESYHFDEPKYLALDQRQYLYVADQNNNVVKIFDTKHRLVGSIQDYPFKNTKISLNHPEGVEVVNQHVWISDTYNNRVLLYKLKP